MQIVTSFKLLPKLAELDNKIWGQFSSWHKITPPVAQIKSYFHRKVLFSMLPWVKGLIVTQASVCHRWLVLTFSNTRTTTPSGALSGTVANLGLVLCSCALALEFWWQFPRVPGFCLVLPLLMAVLRAGSAHHSLSRGYTAPAHTNSCPVPIKYKYKYRQIQTQPIIHSDENTPAYTTSYYINAHWTSNPK